MWTLIVLWIATSTVSSVEGFATIDACRQAVIQLVGAYREVTHRRSVLVEFDGASFTIGDMAVGVCASTGAKAP